MTTEQSFFLQVLSDHLHNRRSIPETMIDWPILSIFASNHEVSGILYKQCQAFLPASTSSVLAQRFSSNLYLYANRVKQYQEIASKLQEYNIPFYTVKGLDVA